MTDGPFRNADLSSRWKKYGRDLVNDATSLEERTAQACRSMLGDVDMNRFRSLLSALRAHAQRPQLDLDPVLAIDGIFGSQPTSPQTDIFYKHMIANIRDGIGIEAALDRALPSAATDWIAATKNRIDEECIASRDLGHMNYDDYRKALERNRDTFSAVSPGALRDALIAGNKRAFNKASPKKAGVDEGPEE